MEKFKVRATQCETCIYKPNSPLDLERLEAEIADEFSGFKSWRICHHSNNLCCRGFWNKHGDKFQIGQVASRLGLVEFTNEEK